MAFEHYDDKVASLTVKNNQLNGTNLKLKEKLVRNEVKLGMAKTELEEGNKILKEMMGHLLNEQKESFNSLVVKFFCLEVYCFNDFHNNVHKISASIKSFDCYQERILGK